MPTPLKKVLLTTSEIAYGMGVTTNRVSQFINQEIDPLPNLGKDFKRRGKPIMFDLQQVLEWYVRRQVQNKLGGARHLEGVEADGGDVATVIDFHVEKARLTKAQADEKELALAEKRGELLPLDVIDEVIGPVIDEFRSTVDAIPAELGRTCPELSASSIDVVKRVLARFSNSLADRRFSESDLA